MPSRPMAAVGVGLQVAGLTAAAYYWSQLAEIGGCGRGGKYGNIVIGPPCPAGTHNALLVMLIGLGLGMLGAFLYAVGASDQATGRVSSGRLWLAQLRFWSAAAVAYALQYSVGPKRPLDALSARGEAVPVVGTFFEARNLRRAFDGFARELGPKGGLSVFSVLDHSASASGVTSGGRRVSLEVDAAAVVHLSNKPPSGPIGATVSLARLRPEAIERVAREAEWQSQRKLVGIALAASTRNWVASVKEPGLNPFVANLHGSGVHRLDG